MRKMSVSKSSSAQEKPEISENKGEMLQEAFNNLHHSLGALIYASPIYRDAADNITKSALKDFAANIASVTSPETMEEIANSLMNFSVTKEVGEKTFDLDGHAVKYVDFIYNIQQLHPRLKTDDLLGKSLVLIMISQFDIFEANIIKAIYNAFPKKIDNSKHTITFSELTKFDSIDEARNHVIDSEIDSILRGSHTKHINAITEIGDFKIDRTTDVWKNFIEVTERRNLFAHTDGVVTKQYINVLKENDVNIPSDIKIGSSLLAHQSYVEHCYECLIEMAICTTHVAWRKIYGNENKYADLHIFNFLEALIKQRRFLLASRILDAFLNKMNVKWHDDVYLKQLIIDLAYCYKAIGMNDKSKTTLLKTNWSSSDPKFRMQKAVIEENHSEAEKFMRKVGNDEEFPASRYIHSPIFENFVSTNEFQSAFHDIFGISPDTIKMISDISRINNPDNSILEDTENNPHGPKGQPSEIIDIEHQQPNPAENDKKSKQNIDDEGEIKSNP